DVLQERLVRTRKLVATIDRTIQHLKGTRRMTSKAMFAGFSVGTGHDRFGEHVTLGGDPNDCKVSAKDTNGAMCVFEFTGGGGGPRHSHFEQDEWIYVVDGEIELLLAEKRLRLGAGESVFIPRTVAHVWSSATGKPVKIINVYQPAGEMEAFFKAVDQAKDLPTREQVLQNNYTEEQIKFLHDLFESHGMDLLRHPLIVEPA